MPFEIEPVQKPIPPPDNVEVYLRKTDPARTIFDRIFFIGTEVFNLKDIDDYAWIYPKLSDEITNFSGTQEGYAYFFGQTEPMVYEGEQVMVPVIICVKSLNPLPFQLSITSVQAQDEEIIDLKRLMLRFDDTIVYEHHARGKGRKLSKKYTCEILKLFGRVSTISKADEVKYTYSNMYLPFPSYLKRQVEECKNPESCDVNVQYDGKSAHVCISKSEDLSKQAKFAFLKYIKGMDMDDLDISKIQVNESIIEDIVNIFKEGIKNTATAHAQRKESLQLRLKDAKKAESLFCSLEVIKYYPIDADGEICVKPSKFVNRYFGNATRIVQ